MRIISVFNNKGGVGKTTLTFHLAHAMATLGKRVLLIDLDPQCNLSIYALDEQQIAAVWAPEDSFVEDFEAARTKFGSQKLDELVSDPRVRNLDWVLGEEPRAYSWDPESVNFYKSFDLNVEKRDTSYTSVHYLVRPTATSPLCCEIQVRTLFEEIWGEVDHRLNYPNQTKVVSCREQLMVLSKLSGAGSRLLDSIRRSMPRRTK